MKFNIFILLLWTSLVVAIPIDRYAITIEGITYDQNAFSRVGSLYLAPSLDILIVSGRPASAPEVGALWFMSNRAMGVLVGDKNSASGLDLTTVEVDGSGTVVYRILENVAAPATSALNMMNAYGGLTASVYYFARGTVVISYANNGLTGTMDTFGRSYNSSYEAHYQARFSGTLVETFVI